MSFKTRSSDHFITAYTTRFSLHIQIRTSYLTSSVPSWDLFLGGPAVALGDSPAVQVRLPRMLPLLRLIFSLQMVQHLIHKQVVGDLYIFHLLSPFRGGCDDSDSDFDGTSFTVAIVVPPILRLFHKQKILPSCRSASPSGHRTWPCFHRQHGVLPAVCRI